MTAGHPEAVADQYRVGDEADILALNRMEYGPTDILVTPEDFEWRCARNPAGHAIIPVIRDRRSDSVIGFIWIVPLRIRVKGQDRLVATGTNLVIHPRYRNTFGYTKLIRRFEQAFKDNDIPLHFSFVSEETYRRQREQDPETVSTVPLLAKPLDFESLARTYSTKKWQRLIIGQAGRLVSPFLFRQRPVPFDNLIRVQTTDQFGDSFDEFWSQVRDKYPVMVTRNRSFLSWRFAPVSARSYRILVAWAGDQMLGYAVLRCATIHGVKAGLIMDLLVADSPLSETACARLVTEAEAHFRARKMSVVAGLVVSFATEYHSLRRAGYVSLPRLVASRAFRFALFSHNTAERGGVLWRAREWFVTLADYESF